MKEKKAGSRVSVVFMQMSVIFAAALLISNILETKQIAVGPINLTCGLLTFPICYIINDCVCEVWGYRRAGLLIWTGFLVNLLFVFICGLCDMIPGASYWTNQEGFHAIFALAPRISVASFVAFIAGGFTNAYVLSRRKIATQGKRLAGRLVLSSLAGETVDSLLFFPIAFLGVLSGRELIYQMLLQLILKTLYEIIFLPLTVPAIQALKKYEGEDAYDHDISYGIFEVFNHKKSWN